MRCRSWRQDQTATAATNMTAHMECYCTHCGAGVEAIFQPIGRDVCKTFNIDLPCATEEAACAAAYLAAYDELPPDELTKDCLPGWREAVQPAPTPPASAVLRPVLWPVLRLLLWPVPWWPVLDMALDTMYKSHDGIDGIDRTYAGLAIPYHGGKGAVPQALT